MEDEVASYPQARSGRGELLVHYVGRVIAVEQDEIEDVGSLR